ncbi:MAG: DUF3192 domain-containing protein [Gammaproteobacteria bacterium]|nr:DUF3192 domain-containing protein [Gammaproteobacteria bacterium]NNJ73038.1 DUF3192 domain-containing protein [Enterobacterales bacterium]
MSTTLRLVTIILTTAYLSGCVIVAGDVDEFDRNDYNAEWQSVEKDNRAKIASLSLGDDYATTMQAMGQANFSEAYETDGNQYQILYYRTHRVESDGETTKDETTPLVFKNQRLIGWGQDALQRIPL